MGGTDRFFTNQENFWAGEFGDSYGSRNSGPLLEASNRWFFAQALRRAGPISSVLELGANVGLNIRAIEALYPDAVCDAVEINESAATSLRTHLGEERVYHDSLLTFDERPKIWDLVLCKGILIHVAPEELGTAYRVINQSSARLILFAEYYSPTPEDIVYRGHTGRLFKRDFAGEFMDAYPDFKLRDYGFAYRRDPIAPQDDITWFLMERKAWAE